MLKLIRVKIYQQLKFGVLSESFKMQNLAGFLWQSPKSKQIHDTSLLSVKNRFQSDKIILDPHSIHL